MHWSAEGLVYRVWQKLHRIKVRILWKSVRKLLKKIGEGDRVVEVPTIMGPKHIEIGKNCFIGAGVRMEAWEKYHESIYSPEICIGDNVTLTDRCYISCVDKVVISDNVLLGRDVFVTDNSHGTFQDIDIPPVGRMLFSKGQVTIGRNVWIGRNSTILSGVTIGENSIIGANSLVNRDIPANCMAAGSPATIIKMKE